MLGDQLARKPADVLYLSTDNTLHRPGTQQLTVCTESKTGIVTLDLGSREWFQGAMLCDQLARKPADILYLSTDNKLQRPGAQQFTVCNGIQNWNRHFGSGLQRVVPGRDVV